MKHAKRICALVVALCLFLPVTALADSASIISLGADLTQEQRDEMLKLLQPADGTATRLITVTNQEEKELLGSYISAAQIGTRSISCSSVTLLESGKGITVTTHNITWATGEMYKNALITAGISDASVVVAAPFQVSGTAALAGIYKAYESAAGSELKAEAKDAAGEELALTGQLGELLGQEEAAALIAQLKEEVIKQGLDTPEAIRPAIRDGAKELGIELTDEQVEMLTQLLLKLIKLDIDPDKLAEQVVNITKTLENLQKAQQSTAGFFQKVQDGWTSVVNWFKGIFGKK